MRSSLHLADEPSICGKKEVAWGSSHLGDAGAALLALQLSKRADELMLPAGTATGEEDEGDAVRTWNLSGNATTRMPELCNALQKWSQKRIDVSSSSPTNSPTIAVRLDLSRNSFTHAASEAFATSLASFEGPAHDRATPDGMQPSTTLPTALRIVELDLSSSGMLQDLSWIQAFGAAGRPPALPESLQSPVEVLPARAKGGEYATQEERTAAAMLKKKRRGFGDPPPPPPLPRLQLVSLVADHENFVSAQLHDVFEALGAVACLEKLSMRHCHLDCGAAKGLAKGIARCAPQSALKEVHLANNSIGCSGLRALAESLPATIEVIDLSENPLGSLTAIDAESVRMFGSTGYDPRGLEALARSIKRAPRAIRRVELKKTELATNQGLSAGADRGGVSEICEASRWADRLRVPEDREGISFSGLFLTGNGFNERTKRSLHRVSGFRAVL